MLGAHSLKTWSTNQHIIVLSSGEAELYALTKAGSQTSGVRATAADLGIILDAVLYTDSTAAIRMTFRTGVGKVRHIRVQYLWLQEKVADKELGLDKVLGTLNQADLMTKGLAQELLNKHLGTMGFHVVSGRALTAPKIGSMTHTDTWQTTGQEGIWRRSHDVPRNRLFTPCRIPGGLEDVSQL